MRLILSRRALGARWLACALIVSSLGLAAAACADDSDDADRDEDAASAVGDAGTDESEAGGESETGDPDTSSADEEAEILGSTRGQHQANPNDDRLVPLRIEVVALERNDDLVELALVLTNEAEPTSAQGNELIFEPWSELGDQTALTGNWDLSGVGLVDQDNQKLYLPVLDSEGVCLCTGDLANMAIRPGESVDMSATFGGLPDDVAPLDLHVPGFAPLTGLEVED